MLRVYTHLKNHRTGETKVRFYTNKQGCEVYNLQEAWTDSTPPRDKSSFKQKRRRQMAKHSKRQAHKAASRRPRQF